MNTNEEEINRMQQEAVRRVRDMQNRAKKAAGNGNFQSNGRQNQPQNSNKSTIEVNDQNSQSPSYQTAPKEETAPPDLMQSLFKDKEKSLLLILLILLNTNDKESDSGLMFALMYLLI